LHVVSQVAVESGLGSVRAFAGDLHAFKAHLFFFWVLFREGLGRGKYCLVQNLW
jgi:hypothetical protein